MAIVKLKDFIGKSTVVNEPTAKAPAVDLKKRLGVTEDPTVDPAASAPVEKAPSIIDAPLESKGKETTFKDIPSELGKTALNFATFPVRVAKDTIIDIPAETYKLIRDNGLDAGKLLAEGFIDTAGKILKPLQKSGEFILGSISKGIEKVTGYTIDPKNQDTFEKAIQAIDTPEKRLAVAQSVSSGVQEFIVEHPDQLMLLLDSLNKGINKTTSNKKTTTTNPDDLTPLQKENIKVATEIENSNALKMGDKVATLDELKNITDNAVPNALIDKAVAPTPKAPVDIVSSAARATGIPQAVEAVGGAIKTGVEGVNSTLAGSAESLFRAADATIKAGKQGAEKLVSKPIPDAYKSALKETPTARFDEYASAAQKATESFKNPTPLEIAGTKAQGALDTIQRKLDTIGSEKSGVMDQASVGNKTVGNIAVKFRRDLGNIIRNNTLVEGDGSLVKNILARAEALGSNPTAKQVDGFIDYVQNEIYTSGRNLSVPITDSTTASLRRLTGELNESLKSQLPDSYRNLNEKYSKMVETRNELNEKLGKEGEKGGALMKRVFSPSDARTKQLFADVKEITGVDLVDEATVARFVMEAVGDSRQASLLQQLQLPSLSKRGIIDFVLEKLTSKLNTPEAQLERARNLTGQ